MGLKTNILLLLKKKKKQKKKISKKKKKLNLKTKNNVFFEFLKN
jgi:hypothetical protein